MRRRRGLCLGLHRGSGGLCDCVDEWRAGSWEGAFRPLLVTINKNCLVVSSLVLFDCGIARLLMHKIELLNCFTL